MLASLSRRILQRGLHMSAPGRATSSLQFEHLELTEPAANVVRVALNRPKKSNALNLKLWEELTSCFHALGRDPDCRVIVLAGNGKNFCAGIDLQDFAQMLGEQKDVARTALDLYYNVRKFQDSFTAIEQCPKPVIAAVQGMCIGGGVDMIAACDIRYCSEDAKFQIKEVELGLAADVGTLQRLPKIVGNDSIVRELCYTARMFGAKEAKEYGLVSGTSLDEINDLANSIASMSPVAVTGTKVNLNYSRDHTIQDSLDYMACWNASMLQTEDIPAAVQAFMKKTTATFSKL